MLQKEPSQNFSAYNNGRLFLSWVYGIAGWLAWVILSGSAQASTISRQFSSAPCGLSSSSMGCSHSGSRAPRDNGSVQGLLRPRLGTDTVISDIFCWLPQITRQVWIQGWGNRLHLLIGVSAKAYWKGHGSKRGRELMPFLAVNMHSGFTFWKINSSVVIRG